jgi:hypothetical protein
LDVLLADEEEGAEGGGGSDDDLTGDLDAALSSSLGGGVSSNLAAAAATPPHQGGSQAEGGSLREEEGESGLAYSYNEEIDDSVTGHGPALDAYAQTQVGGGWGAERCRRGSGRAVAERRGGGRRGGCCPASVQSREPPDAEPAAAKALRAAAFSHGFRPLPAPIWAVLGRWGGVSRAVFAEVKSGEVVAAAAPSFGASRGEYGMTSATDGAGGTGNNTFADLPNSLLALGGVGGGEGEAGFSLASDAAPVVAINDSAELRSGRGGGAGGGGGGITMPSGDGAALFTPLDSAPDPSIASLLDTGQQCQRRRCIM